MIRYQEDIPYQLKRLREISNQAEVIYGDAEKLGNHAAHVFGGRTDHRSQMTGLEAIVNSTFKTSDVFDYVKKQTARHREWQQGYPLPQGDSPNVGFGERLLKFLQGDLATRRDAICAKEKLNVDNVTDDDKQERRHIHLLLMREFIRQMVVQYEFANAGNKRRGG